MKSVDVSFVITAFNAAKTIHETIDSLSQCGVTDFEVIVVDDGSEDSTFEVSRSALRPYRHRLIRLGENHGAATAANIGINHAVGRYIARIDADDLCVRNRLVHQIEHLQKNTEIAFCGGALEHFGAATGRHQYPSGAVRCCGTLPVYCCYGHPSVTFDRSRINFQWFYDPRFKVAHDYHLWAHLFINGIFGDNVEQCCTLYRRHDNQITKSGESSLTADNLIVREAVISRMLLPDQYMSSMIFSLYLTANFNHHRPDLRGAIIDIVDQARPRLQFAAPWEITKSWIMSALETEDTSNVRQSSLSELSLFALRTHAQVLRRN